MKWFLKVWMALLAAFTQCLFGGTNCHVMSWLWRYLVMDANASLSSILKQGLNPLLARYEYTLSNTLTIVVALQSLMAPTMMALVV